MAKKEKNRQIVLLTLFAMTLVVAGHSDITDDFKELWIYRWAYSFHMPLFFFISGFLFAFTVPATKFQDMSVDIFIRKKAMRLLIPFLFINTIIFFIKASVIKDHSIMQHPVELTWKSFLESTFLRPMGFMWFLPALFTIFVIVCFIRKMLLYSNITKWGGVFLTVILGMIFFPLLSNLIPLSTFMQISSAMYYITFFLLGLLYCDYKKEVDGYIHKYWFIIVPVFLLASVSLYFNGYIAAFCGITFSVALSLIFERYCPDRFVKLSGFCYLVFLLSYFPQMFIRGH